MENFNSKEHLDYVFFKNEIGSYQSNGMKDFEQINVEVDTFVFNFSKSFKEAGEYLESNGINYQVLGKIDTAYRFVAKKKFKDKIYSLGIRKL